MILLCRDPRGSPMWHVAAPGVDLGALVATTLCGQSLVTDGCRMVEVTPEVARRLCFGCAGRARIDLCAILGKRGTPP